MKRAKILLVGIVAILIIIATLVYALNINDEPGYTIKIESFTTENSSYVEYPQIIGLQDQQKQDEINRLLKGEVLLGAKNYMGELIVDFSDLNYHYNYHSGFGLANKNIASFWCEFDSYGSNIPLEEGGWITNTRRFFCITIDINTGKEITLSDLLVIDERLINSNDGSIEKPDYYSEVNPIYHHTFKDAFMIYTTEEEHDIHHIFTAQEIIEMLTDSESETYWYINEEKSIVFSFDDNTIKIPYHELSDIIYPEYLAYLEAEGRFGKQGDGLDWFRKSRQCPLPRGGSL